MNHLYKCNSTNTMLYVSKMLNSSFRFLINNGAYKQDIKLDKGQVNAITGWLNLNNSTCLGVLDEEINIIKTLDNKYCLKFYNPYIQICLSDEEFKQLVDFLSVTDN